jgi:hypothetical protein
MSTDHLDIGEENFNPLDWVSQAEAAKIRGVTRQAIARLVRKGRFTPLLVGGKILLKRWEIERFRPKTPGPSPREKSSSRKGGIAKKRRPD